MAERTLRDLAIATGTDKEGAHHYTGPYERHMARFRGRPLTLLEIGVGGYADRAVGGESLRMWKAYFPEAHVIGLDIQDKTQFSEPGITILQGDQSDAAFLDTLAGRFGPFDIVIDDGSHQCPHVIASFEALFPHVRDGGVYVIEDLQTAYWERYGGSTTPNTPGTSMTMLQRLTDGLNHAEFDIPDYRPSYTDRWITSITFHHNIAFIDKGRNDEPSNLMPPHPHPGRRFAVVKPEPKPKASRPRRIARRILPLGLRRAIVAVSGRRARH